MTSPAVLWVPGVNMGELLYADDTAVVTSCAATAKKALRAIEPNAVHYGLRLNRSKCEAVAMEEEGANIRFDDGTEVAQTDAAKYLGCHTYA